MIIAELLQIEFMQRALLAGLALAPVLALLGSFATLRKMSFFADGIAHASLLGVALALMVGALPFVGALVVGVVFGLVTYLLERHSSIASDSIIGTMFTTGLALGVILISLQPGYQPDLLSFLFGSILSVSWDDVYIILGASAVLLGAIWYLRKALTMISFSPELAWTSGLRVSLIDSLFYIMLALAVVLGVKLLGVILVSALLITPAVTSKLITNKFSSYLAMSVVFGTLSLVGGLVLSYILDLPSGATIVVTASGLLMVTMVGKWVASKI